MIVHMRHQLVSAIDLASGVFASGFAMFPRSSASNGYAGLDIRLQLHSPPGTSHGVTIISGTDKRTLPADFLDTMALPTLYQGIGIIATQKLIESSGLFFRIDASVPLAGMFPKSPIILPVNLCGLQRLCRM
jgi:hypothetical protein